MLNGDLLLNEIQLLDNFEAVLNGYLRKSNLDIYVRNSDNISKRKQLEVDFVCNKGSERIYIQSALTIPDESMRAQETRPFSKIRDLFPKIIITKDLVPPFRDENGILTINIYDFLLKPELV